MIQDLVLKNGTILPSKDACIPVDNIEFSYGYGVYETLKVRNNIVYFPLEHIKRLLESANIIQLTHQFNQKQIIKFLEEFTKNIQVDSYNIKIELIGTNKPDTADIYIFATAPFFITPKMRNQGIKTILINGDRQYPKAKTLNMLISYLAYKEAKKQEAYDALLVDQKGFIHEGTRSNLFYTDGTTIFTPPKETVLDGVTQNTIIEALNKKGIKVVQKALKKEELNSFSGYFLTSTSINILPITTIESTQFSIPPIVKKAILIYDEYLQEYAKKQTPTK
jgi:branched-chain amino acid aminotransferase